jgi:EAL domain-containing protein (putative c-di-GMP-specific phosphodiesterase class I)
LRQYTKESGVNSVVLFAVNKNLVEEISSRLGRLKLNIVSMDSDQPDFIGKLYDDRVRAVVADIGNTGMNATALYDLLNSISRRIPVVVLAGQHTLTQVEAGKSSSFVRNFSDSITVIKSQNAAEIIATLEASGIAGKHKDQWNRSLPFYNPHIAINLFRKNSGLSVLSIDASAFRKIETEYGSDVYRSVRDVFQTLLFEMWGRGGCFRSEDIVCRHSTHGNHFLVFLNRSRDAGTLPRPGVLERIADRINRRLINAMWSEIHKPTYKKRLPECIRTIPNIAVGFYSAMHNPCLDEGEVVNSVVETVFKNAKLQIERMENLQRELMHTLIHREELLFPNFQAIFDLQKLSRDMVDAAHQKESIAPLKSILFGFESLIRVRVDALESYVSEDEAIVSAKFLRPDVLFSIAKATKVGLELDQACVQHAARASQNLPGKLLVNILPRNLYFFDNLKPFFEGRSDVVFEISESEGISNLDLMLQVRNKIRDADFGIAADDFGKGFAGLERVMSLRPDIIKLDRGLIESIHKEPIKQEYVRGLVGAAKILKCTVLAEGVETWEEAEVLQNMGVDLIQGYLLHRPQSAEYITEQLDENASLPLKIAS